MAEAPPRYCSNCGHELSPEDQFCSNCGTPVHRAARVPTPEADVPVPPPRQTEQSSGEGKRWYLPFVAIGVIVLLIWLSVPTEETSKSAGGGGGGGGLAAEAKKKEPQEMEAQPQAENKPRPRPEYTVGQTATVGNVEWTVTDAFVTELLRSGFGTQKRGRFVVVDFTFTNNRPKEVTLDPQLHMTLKDSRGREFGPDPDAYEFVPTRLDIFLEPVNPGISQDGRVI
jgi:hypothetical protein